MAVTWNRCAPDELVTLCQGCGYQHATGRIETCPDVDDVDPTDLFLCDQCVGGLKAELCTGTVTPGARGGKVGRHHPDQSKRAAATVESGTQQAALLVIVSTRSEPRLGVEMGVTCAEASPALSSIVGHTISRNQTATRMGELKEKGLVEEYRTAARDLVKRRTEGDNEGQVWISTTAGDVEAARLTR